MDNKKLNNLPNEHMAELVKEGLDLVHEAGIQLNIYEEIIEDFPEITGKRHEKLTNNLFDQIRTLSCKLTEFIHYYKIYAKYGLHDKKHEEIEENHSNYESVVNFDKFIKKHRH
ncbi:MAG: hypothetical protein RLN62_07110 [Rickettsiales bacterium]